MKDLVTVVTAAHNAAKYIEQTLISVRSQNYAPIEHLVFDAGSCDGSQELLARYDGSYDLKWISEPDRGQSHAFNKAIVASRGRWLYFLNADDYLLDEGAIERVMTWIRGHPGYSIYMGHVVSVDSQGRRTQAATMPFDNRVYTHDVLLHQHAMVVHQGTFYRRCVFDVAGMYSEAYRTHMDYEFHLRATRYFDIAAMEVDVACLRRHEGAKSQQAHPRRYVELFLARSRNGGRLLHRHNAFFLRSFLSVWFGRSRIYRSFRESRLGRHLVKHIDWGRRGFD